jgi:chromosome segregation ATPase
MTKLDNFDNENIDAASTNMSHKDNILESRKTLEKLKTIVEHNHPEVVEVQKKLSLLEQHIDNNIGKKEDIDREINEIDDTLSDIKNRITIAKNTPIQLQNESEADLIEQANI